jgi:hypothetical protein
LSQESIYCEHYSFLVFLTISIGGRIRLRVRIELFTDILGQIIVEGGEVGELSSTL